MAAKKASELLRGAKLVKKAIESGKASGILEAAEPIPAGLARKLTLPNGETISPGLKELLTTDAEWLGIAYDEDEAEIEPMSLEEIVEEHFGEEAISAFGEAYDLLAEDCVYFAAESANPSFLYVGSPDDAGEYAVISLSWKDGAAQIGGFVPFDVWLAQELGALERGKKIGEVPEQYAQLPKALADANGDGRVLFAPKAGSDDEEDDGESDDEEE